MKDTFQVRAARHLIVKDAEIMGLLFDNFENKFVARGRKQGIDIGIEQSKDKLSAWVEEYPEVKKLIEEGKVTMPLEQDNDERQR